MEKATMYIRALREIDQYKDIHIEVSQKDVKKYMKKHIDQFESGAKWDDHIVLYSYVEDMVDLHKAKGEYETLDTDESGYGPWEVNEVAQID